MSAQLPLYQVIHQRIAAAAAPRHPRCRRSPAWRCSSPACSPPSPPSLPRSPAELDALALTRATPRQHRPPPAPHAPRPPPRPGHLLCARAAPRPRLGPGAARPAPRRADRGREFQGRRPASVPRQPALLGRQPAAGLVCLAAECRPADRLLLDRRGCRARPGRRAAARRPGGRRGGRPRLCHPAVHRPAARLRLALGAAPDHDRQPSLVRSPRTRARLARRARSGSLASRGSAGTRAAACSRTPAGGGSSWWRCGRRGRRNRWW